MDNWTPETIHDFSKQYNVNIMETMPEGWKILDGATTAPRGYVWIYNGESRFGGKYQSALLKLKVS